MTARRLLAQWAGVVAEWLLAVVVAVIAACLATGPLLILLRLPPRETPEPGVRFEPAPVAGARVETPYGDGVVVKPVEFWDGPLWQVRLDTGRHVLLRRVDMVVLP